MPKSLRTFLEDCQRELPGEVIHITKEVNPANYDVTAIIKHLGAQKKFPIIIFDKPLNLNGRVGPIKLTMNCEIYQGKTQIALGMPKTSTRPEIAEKCLEMEEHRIPPTIVDRKNAPVKENIMAGREVDLYEIPIMRHHEMDGGPYIVLSTVTKDKKTGIYNCSYHRMEVKSKNTTALYASQRHTTCAEYQVRAINYRNGAMYQSVITPEGDKPWMDLPREGAYLRRCREAVPGVTAVCKQGRHAHYNVFISMKKMSEGDPGRAAAAALTFDHTKNVFVFDDDIDVFNPTDILWAIATRVQPHLQVSILQPLFRGNFLDPSLMDEIKTSGMIVDATKPLDRPFSPVSKCLDDAMARIKLEDYVPGEVLQHIPTDRTTYWA